MGCCFGTQVSPGPSEITKLILKASVIQDDSELVCSSNSCSTNKLTLELSKDGAVFIENAHGSETERPIATQAVSDLKRKIKNVVIANWEKKSLTFEADQTDSSSSSLEVNPWLILNSTEKNSNGYCLSEGDVIKLGRVCFRVREIQSKRTQSSQIVPVNLPIKKIQDNEFSFADSPTADPSSANTTSNDLVNCRICLDCTSEADNPIVNVCKCSGSMKYVHLKCIRRWVDNKILKISSYNLLSFYHKSISCEVCHALIPSDISTEKRRYSLIDFPVMDEPHIILESFVGDKTNGFHMLKFGKRVKMMKLGRGEGCDIKIKDATIALKHAVLSHVGDCFYLKNGSVNHVTQVMFQNKTVSFYQKNYYQLKMDNIMIELFPIREQKTS